MANLPDRIPKFVAAERNYLTPAEVPDTKKGDLDRGNGISVLFRGKSIDALLSCEDGKRAAVGLQPRVQDVTLPSQAEGILIAFRFQ